ncbi:aspartyl-phosphate phosphatase Spo0E family protein [Alkalihalophilus lindianensis]|uniref:Aspartyl-phosphate phosphatase Spo0E family protein n=1 Tax=Alkalihalophilus lindianensis TaxID=1630542 RepID=A0ABU3XCC5_9BACI|nr:aspartyl-phosphate phosphatase Spo0E family protein [Alkalihalophilus lindianensis]MDV2685538.1 aspartyl-phosphate phosphatase Spo0E family protein [Alkalihalophilus lindianensis]
MEKNRLLDIIEKKRNELIHVGSQNGLHSKQAIEVSQQLDDLLNEYDRLLKDKQTKERPT